MTTPRFKTLAAGTLQVGLLESGPADGPPVILLHGFPYDVHAYDEVARRLSGQGCRVIVPWLRGYGPTRFLDEATPRSGQQAALAHDLLALMDALGLPAAVLAGYDWGGRAACIVAALWPERVSGLVTAGGYNIQDIAGAMTPQSAQNECRYWYQYYFQARAVRPAWRRTGANCAVCSGPSGHPDGLSPTLISSAVPRPSRTPTRRRGHSFVPPSLRPGRRRSGIRGDRTTVGPTPADPRAHPDPGWRGRRRGPIGFGAGAGPAVHRPYQQAGLPEIGHNVPQEAPEAFTSAVLALLAAAGRGPAD
ncbi:MAG: alpha/beta hydrolase [Burkholderiaceae bacterium]